ncbi:hypothetical protein Cgig2_015571 [Carnegiea gigantea]|uniref:G-box binding protein multifunctional mosaic region domain-containing protein n=1 Tax=Carnegiea gigantea TaxID=171969 RepID=A0A9Q1K252_9CARY|nr:hypothetical protein Cgig2_015571 [Carnegiea gigantea]
MGSSETDKPAKEPKTPPPPSTQEQALATSTATVNAEWPGYQAYSPIPPHGFLASSPQPHPYMWGVQHIMPPYGTPHPYMAMYPHGGMYAHPSIPPSSYPFSPFAMAPNGVAEASGNTPASTDGNSKPPEGKDKLPIKRSRGSLRSLNMITGKSTEECKTGPSASGACSKSVKANFLAKRSSTSCFSGVYGYLFLLNLESAVNRFTTMLAGVRLCTPDPCHAVPLAGFQIVDLLSVVLVSLLAADSVVYAESASDGSSEGTDENSQNGFEHSHFGNLPATYSTSLSLPKHHFHLVLRHHDSPVKSGGRQEASEGKIKFSCQPLNVTGTEIKELLFPITVAEACPNGSSTQVAQNGVRGAPHALVNHAMPIMAMTAPGALSPVPGPATNLNIGMDYWGSPALSTMPAIRGKAPSAPVAAGIVPAGSRDNLQPQLWLQAECDELAQRAESLKEENANLRSELNHFRSKYEKLVAENTTLKERLGETTKDLGSSQPDERAVTETQESSKTDEVPNGA